MNDEEKKHTRYDVRYENVTAVIVDEWDAF